MPIHILVPIQFLIYSKTCYRGQKLIENIFKQNSTLKNDHSSKLIRENDEASCLIFKLRFVIRKKLRSFEFYS